MAWIGLGLLVFILLPLAFIGRQKGTLGRKAWSVGPKPKPEDQQQKMRRVDQILRAAADNLERLSLEMRKEAGPYQG